jgi:hypothetical protein
MRLTIGMRCKFKKAGEGEHHWREYSERECLLTERSHGSFAVMILGKGTNVELKKESSETVDNQVAWVDEEELDHIDSDFEANLDFIDWYKNHDYDFCGDCGGWFPNHDKIDPVTDEEHICPNEKCPGRLFDSGICPCCETPMPKEGDICPKCDFNWQTQC